MLSARVAIFVFIPTILLFVTACFNSKDDKVKKYEFDDNQKIEQLLIENTKAKNFLVLILTVPKCQLCFSIKNITTRTSGLPPNVIFRSVDVNKPSNKWISQLIRDYSFPTTLIFTPENKLTAYIKGANIPNIKEGFQKAFNGSTYYFDAESPFLNTYTIAGEDSQSFKLNFLDNLISAYMALQQKKKPNEKLVNTLKTNSTNYPYFFNTYLLYKLSGDRNRANDLIYSYNDNIDQFLYSTLKKEVATLEDPNSMSIAPRISLRKDSLNFGTRRSGESGIVDIHIRNTGKSTLQLTDIAPSCNCLRIKWDKKTDLAPGEETNIETTYHLDNKGAFEHKVFIFSNAMEAPKEFTITGIVN
ncbi:MULTISPECIES: DUF1573 domain-containing protein [unclassified Sphingobacterium]|uniref:DUF1573 domain-containing protein n=1 Tax=unclassified Sphingobacterium TaxID=2609468 RepID=UPI0025CDE095|nr:MULTISPECIES: DUF1573 domain-containing protein [unclassified Sphingobacterium]